MKSKNEKILKVMEIAIKYIGKLNENQLDELINRQCKFDIKVKKKNNIGSKVLSKEEEIEIINAINILNKSMDRDETRRYIKSLKFTNSKLISLGEKLGIKIPKGTNKEKIISTLVEYTVGDRLKVAGLREGIMGRSQ